MEIPFFFHTYTIQWSDITWDNFYNLLGIKDFIYFISSPSIQDALFPVKLVFIFFTIVFFCAVIWFYLNSSYLQYKFLQDVSEFFSNEPFGSKKVNKNWKNIQKRSESGSESELKLAIIEADDFLYEILEDMNYQGETFEELVKSASNKISSNIGQVLEAHEVRNAIVYDPDYKIDVENAKRMLFVYETTIKNVAVN